jgi:hypothetical protein
MKLRLMKAKLGTVALLSMVGVASIVGNIVLGTLNTHPVKAQSNDLACNNENFTSSITGGFLSNNPFIRTDKTPKNYSAFKKETLHPLFNPDIPITNVDYKPRYSYTATFNNITEWRGKICAKSVQNSTNDHTVSFQSNSSTSTCPTGGQTYCKAYAGPVVIFEFKEKLGGGTADSWVPLRKDGKEAVYNIPANATNWYHWAWKTNQPTDFRLVVRQAAELDEFDFMMDKK